VILGCDREPGQADLLHDRPPPLGDPHAADPGAEPRRAGRAGHHEELLARKGLYHQLYEAQTGARRRDRRPSTRRTAGAATPGAGLDILAEVATSRALRGTLPGTEAAPREDQPPDEQLASRQAALPPSGLGADRPTTRRQPAAALP
jgi:hypothetical protein